MKYIKYILIALIIFFALGLRACETTITIGFPAIAAQVKEGNFTLSSINMLINILYLFLTFFALKKFITTKFYNKKKQLFNLGKYPLYIFLTTILIAYIGFTIEGFTADAYGFKPYIILLFWSVIPFIFLAPYIPIENNDSLAFPREGDLLSRIGIIGALFFLTLLTHIIHAIYYKIKTKSLSKEYIQNSLKVIGTYALITLANLIIIYLLYLIG